jgi:hypothetical protein
MKFASFPLQCWHSNDAEDDASRLHFRCLQVGRARARLHSETHRPQSSDGHVQLYTVDARLFAVSLQMVRGKGVATSRRRETMGFRLVGDHLERMAIESIASEQRQTSIHELLRAGHSFVLICITFFFHRVGS